ncbi:hypothetical protein TRIP_C20739 [Candidatus Zixiibacteriota bacterium]|nr:hypothetical protein TRIP_C20739 [candidate division Zixibacteria bacterium]
MRILPPLSKIGAFLFFAACVVLFQFYPARTGQEQKGEHSHISCNTCHEVMAQLNNEGFNIRGINNRCRSCHQVIASPDGGANLSFHSDNSRSCLDCHLFHNQTELKAGALRFQVDYSAHNLAGVCGTCHSEGGDLNKLSPGHRDAAKLFHSDYRALAPLSPSETCLMCHAKNSMVASDIVNTANMPRFTEHQSHPLGIPVVANIGTGGYLVRADIDPRIRLFSGKIECQSCHTLTSGPSALADGFSDATDLCRGCHIRDHHQP